MSFRSGNTAASLKHASAEAEEEGEKPFPQWKHCGLIEAPRHPPSRLRSRPFRSGNTAASLKRVEGVEGDRVVVSFRSGNTAASLKHCRAQAALQKELHLSAVETLRPH